MLDSLNGNAQAYDPRSYNAGCYPTQNITSAYYSQNGISNANGAGMPPINGNSNPEISHLLPDQGSGIDASEFVAQVVQGLLQLIGTLLNALGIGTDEPSLSGPNPQLSGDPGQGHSSAQAGTQEISKATSSSESSFLDKLPGYIEQGQKLWEAGKEIYEQFSEQSSDAWDSGTQWAGNSWETTTEIAENSWDATTEFASDAWDGAQSLYESGAELVSDFWS